MDSQQPEGVNMKLIAAGTLALALAANIAQPRQALAWGGDGHRTVAAIAFKLLPPAKAAALDRLLQRSEVIDAASYPDEVIRAHDHAGHFSPWHYVDWPEGAANVPSSACMPDCILQELPKQIGVVHTTVRP
jgi:nuclease S1